MVSIWDSMILLQIGKTFLNFFEAPQDKRKRCYFNTRHAGEPFDMFYTPAGYKCRGKNSAVPRLRPLVSAPVFRRQFNTVKRAEKIGVGDKNANADNGRHYSHMFLFR